MEAVAEPLAAIGLASITLDGTPVPLSEVVADVTIRHGRTGFFDSASASTCQIILTGVTRAFVNSLTPGAKLVVNHDSGTGTAAPRFTGTVTDMSTDGHSELTLQAVGILSTVGSKIVQNGPYSAQTWTARVDTVLTAVTVAIPHVIGVPIPPLGNPPLAALTVVLNDEPTVADWLDSMIGYMGAAVADMPDGKLLVQPANSRTTVSATNVLPSDVLYAPEWVQVMPGYNDVWFDADTAGSAHGMNSAAQAKYGIRRIDFETTISDPGYSADLAAKMAARQGMPKWVIEGATLLSGHLFTIGQPLRFSGFPAAAPHSSWVGILEGWTDHIYSDGDVLRWTMDVALSDPALSGVGTSAIQWDQSPSDISWDTSNPATSWDNALTIDDLYP